MTPRPLGATADGVPDTTVVVPCFNEERRLDPDAFRSFARDAPGVRFLFVDDGSTDGTRCALEDLCATAPGSFDLLAYDDNRGKAEAVRVGILEAAKSGAAFVGFWDADLATPLDELPRLRAVLDELPHVEMVLGSRVNLLGRRVHRKLTRHYAGRAFATLVAVATRLQVYDTQCGAKLFRCTDDMVDLFREPFQAKWIFDAELLVRALDARGASGPEELATIAYELPLTSWEDVDGSKVRLSHFTGAVRDALRIYGQHVAVGVHDRREHSRTRRIAVRARRAVERSTTERPQVSPIDRAVRTVRVLPTFCTLEAWTRARAILIGPATVESTSRSGHRFRCHLPDLIQTYIYLFGIWEPDLTAFIGRRLAEGDVFVDVGANIGYHTLVAHAAVGDTGRVVAIEASPAMVDALQRTLADNGHPRAVRVVHAAVASERGELTMYRGPVQNVGLSTSLPGRGFRAEATVESAPLGDLLREAEVAGLRLVKIDVEGAEDGVIRGLVPLLERVPDRVEFLVELSPKWWADRDLRPPTVLRPFRDAGFHLYEIDNDMWPWRYLWPNAVAPPRRMHWSDPRLDRRPKRFDLVLSRVEAPHL